MTSSSMTTTGSWFLDGCRLSLLSWRIPSRLVVGLFVFSTVLLLALVGPPTPRVQISLRWPSDEEQVYADAVGRRLPRDRPAAGKDTIVARIRRLPDVRPTRCLNFEFKFNEMERSTTLVLPFSDYEFYDAEVTLTSVFNDVETVGRDILAEIILVDVASSLDYVRRDVDKYMETMKMSSELLKQHSIPVRLVRIDTLHPSTGDGFSQQRRQWPLEVGAKAARTDVVAFVRPGVVVGRGWLAPIVHPLVARRRVGKWPSAVASHADRLRSLISLQYGKTNDDLIPLPAWSLAIRMRRIPVGNRDDRNSNESAAGIPLYRRISVLRGGAFAIKMSDLKPLGGMFDNGLDVEGGGEYLDLSFRLWMCGKGITQATCSRVGVPDIDDDVRVVSPLNARRLADKWFGTRKALISRFGGTFQNDLAAAGDNEEESPTVISAPDQSKCKNFEWYLKTAALNGLMEPHANDSLHFGILKVQTDHCARVGIDLRIDLDVCNTEIGPQPDTVFELTTDGRLLVTATGLCLTVNYSNYVFIERCKHPLVKEQTWQFNENNELIVASSKLCATQVTDPDEKNKGRQIIMVQTCSLPTINDHYKFKTWQFKFL